MLVFKHWFTFFKACCSIDPNQCRILNWGKKKSLLGNADESTGGGGVERSPALVVPPVYVGPVFDEKLNHLEVVVDASLRKKKSR
jgi:hypothetical protein